MMELEPEAVKVAADEDSFGPRESPSAAWKRALISPTLLLDVIVCGLLAGIPELAFPQHTRPIPVQNVSGTWVRAWLLDNPYV